MWKDIPGWENKYEVNEYGDVRNKVTNKKIVGDFNSSGYPRITLYDGKRKQRFFRHRLVAELFVSNPNNLPEVDHIDSNRKNCYYKNLKWVNRKNNEHRCYITGTKPYKPFIVEFYYGIESYEHKSELASQLGVTEECVKKWLHNLNNGYVNYGIETIKYL